MPRLEDRRRLRRAEERPGVHCLGAVLDFGAIRESRRRPFDVVNLSRGQSCQVTR